jgi:hypothetical protein
MNDARSHSLALLRIIVQSCVLPEDGGSMSLRNVGIYLQVHTKLHSRRPTLTRETWPLALREQPVHFTKRYYGD